MLNNEAYIGASVWGRKAKDGQKPDPVRVEGAWPAIVSPELFDAVQQGLRARAKGSSFQAGPAANSCSVGCCAAAAAVCSTSGTVRRAASLPTTFATPCTEEGSGACDGRYFSAQRMEDLVVSTVLERILNEEVIIGLVQLVAEEIDATAEELAIQLTTVDAELADVRRRLERLYDALENSDLNYQALSPRILSLRQQEDQLAAARDDAHRQLENRRTELPSTAEINGYVADFREFLQQGTIPERKALIRNFVKSIGIAEKEVHLTYTIPMPSDRATRDGIGVLDFVQSSPPNCTKSRTSELRITLVLWNRRANRLRSKTVPPATSKPVQRPTCPQSIGTFCPQDLATHSAVT